MVGFIEEQIVDDEEWRIWELSFRYGNGGFKSEHQQKWRVMECIDVSDGMRQGGQEGRLVGGLALCGRNEKKARQQTHVSTIAQSQRGNCNVFERQDVQCCLVKCMPSILLICSRKIHAWVEHNCLAFAVAAECIQMSDIFSSVCSQVSNNKIQTSRCMFYWRQSAGYYIYYWKCLIATSYLVGKQECRQQCQGHALDDVWQEDHQCTIACTYGHYQPSRFLGLSKFY